MQLDLALNLGSAKDLENRRPVLDSINAVAAAAYSLRKLRSAYSGSAIRVRRSQDNAEADIGFTSTGDLNTTALLNHVGYENVLLRSEEFNSTTWQKGASTTATPNTTTDPLGGNTADSINTTAANTLTNFIYQNILTAGIKTLSVYAKQNTNRYLWAYGGAVSSNYGALFDLQTGVVTTTNTTGVVTSTSAAITDAGNGWYRCSITYASTSNVYQAFASTNNGSPTYDINNNMTNSTIGSIFAWGAQLQNSGTLSPYQQTVATAWTSRNGFVTTWYDQSGNARNAIQATAGNQPQIATNGAVNLENEKPTILFDGVSDVLVSSYGYASIPYGTSTVASQESWVSGDRLFCSDNLFGGPVQFNSSPNLVPGGVTGNVSPQLPIGTLGVINYTNGSIMLNGNVAGTASGGQTATTRLNIGGGGIYLGNANISEMVVFNPALSTTNRQLLERNQGAYYGISVA